MNSINDKIGITAISHYIPEGKLTIEEIAQKSGLSVDFLLAKIGMQEKRIANDNEPPSVIGTKAAQMTLKKAGIAGKEIDVIIYATAGICDYTIWSAAAKIQNNIGATNASCFEVKNGCNAGNLALHLCKAWLLVNKKNHGLVVCAEGLSKLINYQDQNTASFFMIGDGATATLLSRDENSNQILAYESLTDGSLVDYVKIPGGGTMHFPGDQNYDKNASFFNFSDPIELSHIFEKVYLKNYVNIITKALNESGYPINAITHLFNNQIKQSTSDAILSSLHLTKEQTTTSLTHFGHMGAADIFYGLEMALNQNKIKKNDVVVLASSGTGFTWSAQVIQF